MKRIVIIVLAAVSVMSTRYPAFAAQEKPASKVITYYFHGTFRCYSCTTMEKYAREAIETNFKDALASGKLEFKVVNVEDPGNEHFVNDYKLYTKSLVLSLVKDGKETKSENLDKIWEYVRNKDKFIAYVTEKTRGFLGDVK